MSPVDPGAGQSKNADPASPALASSVTVSNDPKAIPGICDYRTTSQTVGVFPKVKLFRVFVPNVLEPGEYLVTKVNDACEEAWNAGLTPVVSFKLLPADVTAGLWDAKVSNLARWLAGKPEAWIVPWHEPENDLKPVEFTSMFNRVYSVMKTVNPVAKIGYVSMAYCWRSSDSRTAQPSLWKPLRSDFYGCDVYSGNSFPLSAILPEHSGFVRWHQNIVGTGNYMIIERGFIASTAAQKAERVTQMKREVDWLTTSDIGKQCEAYMYWNSPGSENNTSLLLDSQGEKALNYLFGKISP